MNVFETLARSARQWPERTAIIDAGGPLDYQSLWREVEALRLQLDRLGVRRGPRHRRARPQRPRLRHRRAGGAGLRRGHHADSSSDETGRTGRHAGASALVRDSGRRQRPGATRQNRRPWKIRAATACASRGWTMPSRRSRRALPDAAFVRFTSGTTGAAKGVVLTHRDVLERTRAANSGLGLTSADKILWVLPMAYHFYVSIILYLEVGATVIVSADYLAGSLLETAAKHAGHVSVHHAHARAHDEQRPIRPRVAAVAPARNVRLRQTASAVGRWIFWPNTRCRWRKATASSKWACPFKTSPKPWNIPRPLAGRWRALKRKIVDEAMQPLHGRPDRPARLARPGHVFRLSESAARRAPRCCTTAGFSPATWRIATAADALCWMGGPLP